MTRRRATAGSLAAALVLALLGAALGTRAATAEDARETFSVSFDNLLPGETRTETTVLEVPVPAVLATTTAEVADGASPDISWDIELCPVAGGRCLDLSAAVGTPLVAGDHELTVSATLTPGVPPAGGQHSAVVGHLAFVADTDDELATTGAALGVLLVLAVGLVVLGYLLLFAGRPRDDDEGVIA